MAELKMGSINKIVIYFNEANEKNEYAFIFDGVSSASASIKEKVFYLEHPKAILEFDYDKAIFESLEY